MRSPGQRVYESFETFPQGLTNWPNIQSWASLEPEEKAVWERAAAAARRKGEP